MKHRGVVLGLAAISTPGNLYYRIRVGRQLAVVRVEWLPREWLNAYMQWLKSRGLSKEAAALRTEWLAAPKSQERRA